MINELTRKPYIEQKELCPRCGNNLYDTDIREYDFVCLECDENFYKCEV
jgi:acetyl-CoA carboxylase beta subunit